MPPSYIWVRAVVWAYGHGQTDTQTDTQTRVTTIHFASSTTHAKCNNPLSSRAPTRKCNNKRKPTLAKTALPAVDDNLPTAAPPISKHIGTVYWHMSKS